MLLGFFHKVFPCVFSMFQLFGVSDLTLKSVICYELNFVQGER